MFKVTHTCKNHCQVMLIRSSDDFLITYRPARLNHCGDTCAGSLVHTISKRKKSIRRKHTPFKWQLCFHCSYLYRIDAAHLPRADTNKLPVARVNDSVRL